MIIILYIRTTKHGPDFATKQTSTTSQVLSKVEEFNELENVTLLLLNVFPNSKDTLILVTRGAKKLISGSKSLTITFLSFLIKQIKV